MKEFKAWLEKYYGKTGNDIQGYPNLIEWFEHLPLEFQWGVYLKYFDDKGAKIWIEYTSPEYGECFDYMIFYKAKYYGSSLKKGPKIKTREEAMKKAIDKVKETITEN